jgi:hypothetical protein
LQLGATGSQPTILGVMRDDGLNGDLLANDGIYTLRVAFNQATSGQIQMEVSAAFQGLLKRVVSVPATVNVWNVFTDTTQQLQFNFPPTQVVDSTDPTEGDLIFAASPVAPADPPLFAIQTFQVSGTEPSIMDAINERFSGDLIFSTTPLAQGFLVSVDDFAGLHYIGYDPLTNRAVDVSGFDQSQITESDFLNELQSMRY